jgi:hypothetical protein
VHGSREAAERKIHQDLRVCFEGSRNRIDRDTDILCIFSLGWQFLAKPYKETLNGFPMHIHENIPYTSSP